MHTRQKSLLVTITCMATVSAAYAAQPSFAVMLDSDAGDYIGQGQLWYADSDDAYITIDTLAQGDIKLTVEAFDATYRMTFGSNERRAPGLYTPAKRAAFRGSFNGIDISGEGRGCNKISGSFYIHQITLAKNLQDIESLALDFVQHCEEQGSALYGSIRVDTDISLACTSNGCDAVRKRFGGTPKPTTTSRPTTNPTPADTNTPMNSVTPASTMTEQDQQSMIEARWGALIRETQQKYPLFFDECFTPAYDETPEGESIIDRLLYQDDYNYYMPHVCNKQYPAAIKLANRLLVALFGPNTTDDVDEDYVPSRAEIQEYAGFIDKILERIDALLAKKEKQGKLTDNFTIALSSIAFVSMYYEAYFEIMLALDV